MCDTNVNIFLLTHAWFHFFVCTNTAGKFQDQHKKTSCKDCLRNTKSERSNSSLCTSCGVGEKSEPGSAKCTKCDAGEAGTGSEGTCEACVAGQYRTSNDTAASCKQCPLGWSSEPGSTKCQSCEAGTFSTVVGEACKNCDAGQYRPSKAVDGVTSTDPTTCVDCPIGFSQSDSGQATCIKCSPGEFNDVVGAESCTLCTTSTYFGGKGRDSSCIDCPIGWSSEDGSAKCQACGAGTFGEGCQFCPIGYARHGSDSDATTCRMCKLGETTTNVGAATCEKCDLGKYGNKEGECTFCLPGQYQDGKGETQCKACEIDTYLSKSGKSSKADCDNCDSEKSTGTATGNTEQSSCLCRRTKNYQNDEGECVSCPVGADCSKKDGISVEEIIPQIGFWRPSIDENIFLNCADGYLGVGGQQLGQQRCCPMNTTTNTSVCKPLVDSTNEQCLDGYQGPLCRACNPNTHVVSGNGCKTCEGGASFSAAALSLAGFLSIFYLFALLVLIRSKPPRDAVGRAKARRAMKIRIAVVGQFKLLLNFLQVLTSMDKTCNSVPWPLNFRSFLSFLDVINLDVMGLFVGESTLLFVLFLCSCVLVFLCSCVLVLYESAHTTQHTLTHV